MRTDLFTGRASPVPNQAKDLDALHQEDSTSIVPIHLRTPEPARSDHHLNLNELRPGPGHVAIEARSSGPSSGGPGHMQLEARHSGPSAGGAGHIYKHRPGPSPNGPGHVAIEARSAGPSSGGAGHLQARHPGPSAKGPGHIQRQARHSNSAPKIPGY
ncbi:hypothetical protein M427DRAFT_173480 [Gonapodya prolifera JEL478]|uniref:Uncharacterized protein n=1 Tax=Gonapodya prolifera (strain JEL478) TaxID=1344416 RepID=A0A139B0F6_GONPJ|nr:hypothetical protein M427DRAFT_173480 [Gonapodya prolifera JEL478]|eukprot:KXS22478.1 hypothetical protein M427DRAFT_173480 [Gonapodya prolifera JEL478]